MEAHDGVPGPFHADGGFADGALERLVGALAVDNPREHAVLMRLERARARVDPGRGGVGGLLVVEADEASSRGVEGSRGRRGYHGVGCRGGLVCVRSRAGAAWIHGGQADEELGPSIWFVA